MHILYTSVTLFVFERFKFPPKVTVDQRGRRHVFGGGRLLRRRGLVVFTKGEYQLHSSFVRTPRGSQLRVLSDFIFECTKAEEFHLRRIGKVDSLNLFVCFFFCKKSVYIKFRWGQFAKYLFFVPSSYYRWVSR